MLAITKNFLTLITITLVVSIFQSGAFATEIRYSDYNFSQDLVQIPKSDIFILCNNCPKTQLSPYKAPEEKPLTIVKDKIPGPVISIKVSENEKRGHDVKQEITTKQEIFVPLKIYFNFNSFSLKENEKEKLIDWSKSKKEWEVEVTGYACPIGSEDYNKILSAKRAGTVSEILKEEGVKVLKARGVGETTKFGEKQSEYYLNRVVEIIPIKKGGETK